MRNISGRFVGEIIFASCVVTLEEVINRTLFFFSRQYLTPFSASRQEKVIV